MTISALHKNIAIIFDKCDKIGTKFYEDRAGRFMTDKKDFIVKTRPYMQWSSMGHLTAESRHHRSGIFQVLISNTIQAF